MRACRIGEAVVAIALPPGRDASDIAIRLGEREATRLFAAQLGAATLVFGSLADLPSRAGEIVLDIAPGDATVACGEGASDLLAGVRISEAQAAEILVLLANAVGRMFGLYGDRRFARFLIDTAGHLGISRSRMQVFGAEGYRHAAARYSSEARFGRNAIFVALVETESGPECEELEFGGTQAFPPNRIARVSLARGFGGVKAVMALGLERALWFDADTVVAANAAQFHAHHAAHAPELIAVLTEAPRSDLGAALLAEARLAPLPKQSGALPRSAFRFSIETTVAFGEGLFLSGWFNDPSQDLREAAVLDFTLRDPRLDAHWQTHGGLADIEGEVTRVTGFCVWLKRRAKGPFEASPPVAITLSSGLRLICRGEPSSHDGPRQRDAVLSAIHQNALEAGALVSAYRPAVMAATRSATAAEPVSRIETYGRASSREFSLVIPLYGDLRFLRSQAFGFATDRQIREEAEIIYVLDDPRLLGEAEQRIRSLAHVTGLDLTLVALSANQGYGAATNLGADAASGRVLALMNSDVVPAREGWLRQLDGQLATLPPHSITGPKLLYADETLQHAGMYFYRLRNGVYQNMHYYKGYGRHFAAANEAREVPALTGALMVLSRESFRNVGGFSGDYAIGDYEDSDLCLKLRARGGICHYVPHTELYHFERQSISQAPDARGAGATAYNRHLHHAIWSADIETLMSRPEFKAGTHAE